MFCGKCGKEVPEGYEFCMGCGAKLEPTPEQIVEPVKVKKKWIIPVAIILLVVIIAGVAIYFISENKKKSGLYNDIPWQISYEELCKLMETKKTGEVECDDKQQIVFEIIEDYKEDVGIDAIVVYSCEDDGTLRSIFFMISNGDDSKYTDSKLFDKYAEELSELYGEGKENSVMTTWETPKSDIRLAYVTDGMITLGYQDITYEEE